MIRKTTTSIAAAAIAAALAIITVGAASAAPADTYQSHRECYPDQWEGQAGTICYTIHDVEKSQSNGKTAHTKEAGSMLIEFFDEEGNTLFSDSTRWHTTVLEKDGTTQVYHDKTRVTFTMDGETCTAEMNAVFANGEVRHPGPTWEWDCK